MHPQAREFLLDEVVQASGYDTKSERYKGLKKLILTMPVDQANALADGIAEALPGTKPGEFRGIIDNLLRGGMSPGDIPKLLAETQRNKARADILGGQQDQAGPPGSDLGPTLNQLPAPPGTLIDDGSPALGQAAGFGQQAPAQEPAPVEPQEDPMSPQALRRKAQQLGAAGDLEGMRATMQMARDIEGGGGVTVNNITEREEAKKLSARDFKLAEELDKDLDAVRKSEASMKAFEVALDAGRFQPGSFSGIRQPLSQVAEFVGMDPENPIMKTLLGTGDPASAEVMHAASNRLALDLADKLSKMTNMSLAFVADSVPNLARTPAGNKLIIDMLRAGNARTREAHDMMERYLSDYGSLRPKGKPSFFQAVNRLYDKPLFDADFEKRVKEEARKGAGVDIMQGLEKLSEQSEIPSISSQEEVEALPPGSKFKWPDGVTYTKR